MISAAKTIKRKKITHTVRMICSNCSYCKEDIEILNPKRVEELLRTAHCPKCKKKTLMQNRTTRLN